MDYGMICEILPVLYKSMVSLDWPTENNYKLKFGWNNFNFETEFS